MIFATNRQYHLASAEAGHIDFDLQNTKPSAQMTFCRRLKDGSYFKLELDEFFNTLAQNSHRHILFYIHGFNNTGEDEIFPHATIMQQLFNQEEQDEVLVVPLIWPCDDDALILLMEDYFDDREAADKSHQAFAEFLTHLHLWQLQLQAEGNEKQFHLLAHSMGNRVLTNAVQTKVQGLIERPPKIFNNIFMVAADTIDRTFERGYRGEHLPFLTHNLVVYHARDDKALLASQGVNILQDGLRYRLGQKGPSNPEWLPDHVYLVDCNEINEAFDLEIVPLPRDGHEYFLTNQKGDQISPLFFHYAYAIRLGEVKPNQRNHKLLLKHAAKVKDRAKRSE